MKTKKPINAVQAQSVNINDYAHWKDHLDDHFPDLPPWSGNPEGYKEAQEKWKQLVPSATEIAKMGALLFHRPPANWFEAKIMADTVLGFWKVCCDRRDYVVDVSAGLDLDFETEAKVRMCEHAGARWPERFPVPLNEFLRLTTRKKSVPDRFKMLRDWVKNTHGSEQAAEAEMERLKQNPLAESDYIAFALKFREWQQVTDSEQHQKSAKAGWSDPNKRMHKKK